jgi:protein-tyrosine sulfotransferase
VSILGSLKRRWRGLKGCFGSDRYALNNSISKEEIRPFFIIGSGRSGNTLLRRMLDQHSELFIPPETYEWGQSIEQFQQHSAMSWEDRVKLIYANFQFHIEFDSFKLDSLAHLYRRVSQYGEDRQTMAHIFDAFYQEYHDIHAIEANRWGDKTPWNTFYLHEIYSVFPNAKFIHIIRDPYDAIYSYVKSNIYSDVKEASKRWRTSIERAMGFGKKYPHDYCEVLYEELVSHPKRELVALCDFLDITYEDCMLQEEHRGRDLGDVMLLAHHANVLKPISDRYIGKGKKYLSKQEIDTINAILLGSKNDFILGKITP